VSKTVKFFKRAKTNTAVLLALAFVFVFCFETGAFAQEGAQKGKKTSSKPAASPQKIDPNLPVVTQIDETAFSGIIKKSTDASRPVLVNFWATWCDPCREEFPDLVKIDEDFHPRGLDFVSISMDDLVDLKLNVPQFLSSMKAKMPAYLLIAKDEGAFLESITAVNSKEDAVVGLPVTILFDSTGKIAYKRSGKIKTDILRAEIEKLMTPKTDQTSNGQ
jgi:thiol-disulfide isomerase/thioredoxin